MSYFDHISCRGCGAEFAPESLGQSLACPNCGAALALPDLFGLKDSFREEEDDTMSIDDLVGGPSPARTPPSRGTNGRQRARREPSVADHNEAEPMSAMQWLRSQKKR